jgi:hypothetical protein
MNFVQSRNRDEPDRSNESDCWISSCVGQATDYTAIWAASTVLQREHKIGGGLSFVRPVFDMTGLKQTHKPGHTSIELADSPGRGPHCPSIVSEFLPKLFAVYRCSIALSHQLHISSPSLKPIVCFVSMAGRHTTTQESKVCVRQDVFRSWC